MCTDKPKLMPKSNSYFSKYGSCFTMLFSISDLTWVNISLYELKLPFNSSSSANHLPKAQD